MILDIDIEYDKFYSNKDIEINNFVTIKHPTVGEILEMGELNFYQSIEVFISRPYDHLVSLYEAGYNFLDIDQYDFFINLFSMCQEDKTRYQYIFDKPYDFIVLKDSHGKFILYNQENDFYIDEYTYYQIHKYLCVMLGIPDMKARPANASAFKMLVRLKKKQQLKNKKLNKRSTFSNYVGSLLACGFTYDEIHKMRVYNIIETINRIKMRDNLNNVMYGLYSGNIQSKDIDLDNYDWVFLK